MSSVESKRYSMVVSCTRLLCFSMTWVEKQPTLLSTSLSLFHLASHTSSKSCCFVLQVGLSLVAGSNLHLEFNLRPLPALPALAITCQLEADSRSGSHLKNRSPLIKIRLQQVAPHYYHPFSQLLLWCYIVQRFEHLLLFVIFCLLVPMTFKHRSESKS